MEKTLHASNFRFGIDLFPAEKDECIDLPFKRSVLAILIVAAMAIAMTIPAISVFRSAAADWGRLDSLFDLVGALFSTGWLMGWSIGLLFLYSLLAVLFIGREKLILAPGNVQLRAGLPFMFFQVSLDPGRIEKLHHSQPKAKSSHAWRGPHLAFEYDGAPMEVGSDLSAEAAQQLAERIQALPPSVAQTEVATGTMESALPLKNGIATPVPADLHDRQNPYNTLPAIALVGANLLPLAGVLLFGWDLGTIMVLFWAESAIIGAYHLLNLAVTYRWLTLLLGPLFIGHFGAFMAVHFLFIYSLFITGLAGDGPGDSLIEVGQLFYTLWPALLALCISHGISFVIHFEKPATNDLPVIREQMSAPYRRIVIMHVTIILGGGLSLAVGTPVFALILLILLKTFVDLRSHRKQHSAAGSNQTMTK
jgi:hypothetical protein